MFPAELSPMLHEFEARLQGVAAVVGSGNAQAVEAASASLQRMTVQLAQLLQERGADLDAQPELRQRLRQMATTLAIQREGLIRQAANVERTLAVLVPATQKTPTYGNPAAARRYNA